MQSDMAMKSGIVKGDSSRLVTKPRAMASERVLAEEA